ncbi:MAG TPA: hypothetical protein VHE80_03615 [Acidimicrobiales bacterium]|nr:hypothetical protein [Acidimicrobiales bacterium]
MDETVALERISVPPWGWLVLALAAATVFVVTLDNGVLLRGLASTAHELFHDARHFAGVPCH